MKRVLERAAQIARAARRRRLEQIARDLTASGIAAAVEGSAVIVEGRAVLRRWLADPAVRFAGRLGP